MALMALMWRLRWTSMLRPEQTTPMGLRNFARALGRRWRRMRGAEARRRIRM
jgi:hypothetical protein